MTIAEAREKCKAFATRFSATRQGLSKRIRESHHRDILVLGVLIFASSASFGLGYLAVPMPDVACALSRPAEAGNEEEALNEKTTSTEGRFVASKNGTKYYLPSCAGAGRIAEANKVWFASAAAARAAGYAPAANCKGL